MTLLLCACGTSPSTLEPRGPRAAIIAEVGWVMFVLSGLVFALVIGLLLYALFHRGAREPEPTPSDDSMPASHQAGRRLPGDRFER